MKNRHFLRLMQVVFTFTALQLYTFTPVAKAEWGATVPNPIMEYSYTYDNNGNITNIYNAVTVSSSTFTYDEVDRLTSAVGPYGTQTYSYDSVGNIQGVVEPTKDANGNATEYTINNITKTIEYDYENRPTKITDTNGTITEFAYDYSGQRVYKKVSSGTITSEDYYIGNIYEESYSVDSSSPIISASTTTVTYVYAGSIRVAGLVSETTAAGTKNNTCYYYGDHLGSSSIITDGSGTVMRNISYQPWGNVNSNTQAPSPSTDYDPKHKFTGQILDDSTNLYYYGARYYDPVLRRFITPDTIVQDYYNPQDLNRYSYAWNNPLRITDPTGHYEWSQTTTKDQFYNKLYLWTQNPYFGITADAAQGVLDMPSIMLGAVGQGYEAAKELVFGNRFAEALIGNYDSKAVDAFTFMYGPAFFKAAENAITYSKTAFSANKLSYNISNWKECGLPSDGYFSRMISGNQAEFLKAGKTIDLAGDKGMGFIGRAEEVRSITSGQGMQQAMGVPYKPDYLLEFQLKDVTGLQNVIKYSDPMWQHGGKTITGFSEYNMPGLTSDMILNWKLRGLK